MRQFLDCPGRLLRLIQTQPAVRKHLKRLRQKRIPGQNSYTLAVDFVVGQFAPPVIIIIHSRQIIMYQ